VCLCVGDGRPTIFVAVAGRSNGLGPVVSGNTSFPVINCPPLSADWASQDIWSSLRLPSGQSRIDLVCHISMLAVVYIVSYKFLVVTKLLHW